MVEGSAMKLEKGDEKQRDINGERIKACVCFVRLYEYICCHCTLTKDRQSFVCKYEADGKRRRV